LFLLLGDLGAESILPRSKKKKPAGIVGGGQGGLLLNYAAA
jgi:hypothetical protein